MPSIVGSIETGGNEAVPIILGGGEVEYWVLHGTIITGFGSWLHGFVHSRRKHFELLLSILDSDVTLTTSIETQVIEYD